MARLINLKNRAEAMRDLAAETAPRTTLSFYKYVEIDNPAMLRDELFSAWSDMGVLGRVYLANEGINAQISIPTPHLDAFRAHIDASPLFVGTPFKIAVEEPATSFWKLTIKVRKQIVADNLPAGSYDMTNVGQHLSPNDFNQALEAGAIVVDMRNKYESDIGKFDNALTPQSQTFGDELREVAQTLADKKGEKVLLYCTGGIRCEKASAFLKQEGFADVNQLSGGVIAYAHAVKRGEVDSKFKGKNYVFDGRMAEAVTPDVIGSCFTCHSPADSYDNCQNDLCHALFIQCAECKGKMLGTCSDECRSIAVLSPEERKVLRKGRKAVFKVLSSGGGE